MDSAWGGAVSASRKRKIVCLEPGRQEGDLRVDIGDRENGEPYVLIPGEAQGAVQVGYAMVDDQ